MSQPTYPTFRIHTQVRDINDPTRRPAWNNDQADLRVDLVQAPDMAAAIHHWNWDNARSGRMITLIEQLGPELHLDDTEISRILAEYSTLRPGDVPDDEPVAQRPDFLDLVQEVAWALQEEGALADIDLHLHLPEQPVFTGSGCSGCSGGPGNANNIHGTCSSCNTATLELNLARRQRAHLPNRSTYSLGEHLTDDPQATGWEGLIAIARSLLLKATLLI